MCYNKCTICGREFMKRFIAANIKLLITIIICAILFTGVGVYATTKYLAKDISYTPSNQNFEVTNVDDALNELYRAKSYDLNYKENFNYGFRSIRTATVNLDKGEYLICASSSIVSLAGDTNGLQPKKYLKNDNSDVCTEVSNKTYDGVGSSGSVLHSVGIWKCILLSNQNISVSTTNLSSFNDRGEVVSIYSIKIDD